jgi:predicted SnoaL-like aldol condensation-catalyzing enzyme
MTKKEMATTFLKMTASGDVRNAYDKFIAPNFIHHNQYFKGDRESLLLAMEDSSRASPNKQLDIQQIFEDGDRVAVFSKVTMKSGQEVAVVHILKFEGTKVVEMWDVGQLLDKNSPNKNGAF